MAFTLANASALACLKTPGVDQLASINEVYATTVQDVTGAMRASVRSGVMVEMLQLMREVGDVCVQYCNVHAWVHV